MKAIALVILAAALVCTLHGCGGAADQHRALNGVTAVVQPSYDAAVEACDAHEAAIIARAGTSADDDRAAILATRETCDRFFGAFEAVRVAQRIARAAIEGGGDAALQAAMASLAEAWAALRALAPEIEGML
jgi:hypothetical protein